MGDVGCDGECSPGSKAAVACHTLLPASSWLCLLPVHPAYRVCRYECRCDTSDVGNFPANKALCLGSLDASIRSQQQSDASMMECICKCTYFLLSPAANTLELALWVFFFLFSFFKNYGLTFEEFPFLELGFELLEGGSKRSVP